VAALDARVPRTPALSRFPSPALVLGAIASVQVGSAIGSKLFAQTGPGGAAFLRLFFGCLLLSLVWRPWPRSRTGHELLLAAVFGLVLAAMNISFYHAIAHLPLGIVVAIELLGPLAVAVIGSRQRRDLVWMALALVGILAMTRGNTHGISALGVTFGLIAAGMWAAYVWLNARLGQTFRDAAGSRSRSASQRLLRCPPGPSEAARHSYTRAHWRWE
jgi:inner membrane transporter RhtA